MSHGTHSKGSWHTYDFGSCVEGGVSHIWQESCPGHECIMAHIRMSHVAYTNEPRHMHECVMPHIQTSHVTHMRHGFSCVSTIARIESVT
mmetsp:Transcript_28721/g.46196  ORF Transcript_28721/g.46196 Transcript_28721/m.46196 type:complete len:90 (+) Transcript_28721:27-296(+)